MGELQQYHEAVETIKRAILQGQSIAARNVNEVQLRLYYLIGGYISKNTREGKWGTGAINAISEQLKKELPGLRGYSPRSLKYMRTFYEEWSDPSCKTPNSAIAIAELQPSDFWQLQLPKVGENIADKFFAIGFTHHITIL